jgi:hypothetical protein
MSYITQEESSVHSWELNPKNWSLKEPLSE